MKRRWIAVALLALMLLSPLAAQAKPSISDDLFDNAKEAVSLMSYGEYKKALKKLNLKNAPDTDEFEEFVCAELSDVFTGTVQNEVAVAYYTGKRWILAVPVEEPSSDSVQAFALASDGKRFTGYKAMTWGDVCTGVDKAEAVRWNVAYDPGQIILVADD